MYTWLWKCPQKHQTGPSNGLNISLSEADTPEQADRSLGAENNAAPNTTPTPPDLQENLLGPFPRMNGSKLSNHTAWSGGEKSTFD